MVGAARFELTTPCAQGIGVTSNGSSGLRLFFVFTTTWGICFSLES